jgi:ABC-type Mn2+/Zn2+ transport system ATPase subunit
MDDDGASPALVVRARRLRAARGVTVAERVELSALPGDVVAVEGPNGSGKSTLLAAAAGLLPSGPGSQRPGTVGYAPERADATTRLPLRPWLVGLARTAGLSRAESARQADDLIVRMGLADAAGRPLRALSRGTMQRALVAQALVGPPQLVVLDEPSGGLDADGTSRLAAEIERAAGQACVVLVARHPTARVPLPPGPAWRLGDATIEVVDRPATAPAAALMEVRTGDGQVRRVSEAELPGVLRAALDAGIGIRQVQQVQARDPAGPAPASPGNAPARPQRGGGALRLLNGAAHRARLLTLAQWFAAPALLYLFLLAAIYSSTAAPPPPPLTGPAFTAVALTMLMTWLGVLAQLVDGRVVARAFGAHVGGPGRAHLAGALAAVPFGLAAMVLAVAWAALSGQPGDWVSAAFLGQVIGLHLAAIVFGIAVASVLVPPFVRTTGWRVLLGAGLYVALVLVPASPMRPLLRVSVGSAAGSGAVMLGALLLAGLGGAVIAVTTLLAARLP